MEAPELNFVDCSGYALTGKSAILELLQEVDGFYVCSRDYEFELLRCMDGILDLYMRMKFRPSTISISLAHKKLTQIARRMGAAPRLLNFFHQIDIYTTKYDRRFYGQFTEITNNYLESLVDYTVYQYVNTPYLFCSKWNFLYQRVLIKIGLARGYKKQPINFLISADAFRTKTNAYFFELFSLFNSEVGLPDDGLSVEISDYYDTFVLSNAIEPGGLSLGKELLPGLKQIVVDRDPRDIFAFLAHDDPVSNNYHKGHSGEYDIDVFVNRYKSLRKVTEQHADAGRLTVRFENLVINYEKTLHEIFEFLTIDSFRHIRRQKHFCPVQSKGSVGLWRSHNDQSEIKYIESALPEYCFDG